MSYELGKEGKIVRENFLKWQKDPETLKRKKELESFIMSIYTNKELTAELKIDVIANYILWKWTEVPALGKVTDELKILNQRYWTVDALKTLEQNKGIIEKKSLTVEHVYPRSTAAIEIINNFKNLNKILEKSIVCILKNGETKKIRKNGSDGWHRYEKSKTKEGIDSIFDMKIGNLVKIQDLIQEWDSI
jgi:hypothetical protein